MIKANAIGDSITYGVFTGENDDSPKSFPEKTWFKIVCEEMGFDVSRNYSVSGISVSSLTTVNPGGAICLSFAKMDDDADIIFIAGGTNDYGTDVPIGSKEDKEDISFYGALDVLCRGLNEKYPKAEKVYIVPIKRRGEGPNAKGFTLAQYRTAIKEVAGERYGYFIIDGEAFGFEPETEEGRKRYMLDGLHPNNQGHILYAKRVCEKLKELL